jgi:hypothetical protein
VLAWFAILGALINDVFGRRLAGCIHDLVDSRVQWGLGMWMVVIVDMPLEVFALWLWFGSGSLHRCGVVGVVSDFLIVFSPAVVSNVLYLFVALPAAGNAP